MTPVRKKRKYRRHGFPAQIRHTETELAAKLVPALKKTGRFIVGRAIIRPFRKKHFLLDFGRLCGKRVRLHRKTVTPKDAALFWKIIPTLLLTE